jgi:hypothetical protein
MQAVGLELIAWLSSVAASCSPAGDLAAGATEWDDALALDALGMTRPGMISAARTGLQSPPLGGRGGVDHVGGAVATRPDRMVVLPNHTEEWPSTG